MKKILSFFVAMICFGFISKAQLKYLSDIILTKEDIQYGKGYATMPFNYWRYDSCLSEKKMCRYNSSSAASVKVINIENTIIYEFLRNNNSGYQSKNPYDTLRYVFTPFNINKSILIRKLLIKDKILKTDTFNLTVTDTLIFNNYSIIKKVFGKSEGPNQKSLKIYVLKSVDNTGSIMLHYWVERIGIVKLTDEKCWRYSFELKGNDNKSIEKMFAEIFRIIKSKYKDPYWLSVPCSFE